MLNAPEPKDDQSHHEKKRKNYKKYLFQYLTIFEKIMRFC